MKVTITLTDKEDGKLGVELDFDPPLKNGARLMTNSALAANIMMGALDRHAQTVEDGPEGERQ